MKETRSAGGVVVNPDGMILVVNQNNDSWSLPKGHIDPGEDALTAAKREIQEESGIPIEKLNLEKELGSYSRSKIALGGGEDYTETKHITMFKFTTTYTDLAPEDPANPEAKWVLKEEVVTLLTHAKDVEFFQSQLQQL